MNNLIAIDSVKPNNSYELEVTFSDGFKNTINFLPFIKQGVSKELLDINMFLTARIDYGTIVWENGYDICPVALRNLSK